MRYFFLFDPVFLPFSPLLSLAPGYVIIRTQLRRIEVFSYLVTRSEMGKQKSNMASPLRAFLGQRLSFLCPDSLDSLIFRLINI